MDSKGRGIDEIIQQAMRAGAFDNLPGKGKPLDLDENPHLDPEWQLAYHLLKQNGFAPDFIEKRQAIEVGLANARQSLMRTWVWRGSSIQDGKDRDPVEAEWGKAKAIFRKTTDELNKQIHSYNLSIPTPTLFRQKIDFENEMNSFFPDS